MKNSKAEEKSKKEAVENKKNKMEPDSSTKQSREEYDAMISNTGLMPGEHPETKAGSDSDAASG